MRTPTALESAVYGGTAPAYLVRVLVADSGGTERDLDEAAQLGGQRWLSAVRLSENLDGEGPTAEVRVRRNIFTHNLSPLMTASGAAYQYGNPGSSTSARALDLNRRVRVQVALLGAEAVPTLNSSNTTWLTVFVGRVDRISVADGEEMVLECRDETVAQLSDAYFEVERYYGLTPSTCAVQRGAREFTASTALSVGDLVVPANLNGFLYRVSVAGTTAATEPTWGTVVGGTTASGTVTFINAGASATSVAMETVLQQMMNDSPRTLSQPTLNAPNIPGFQVTPYLQKRDPILQAMRQVAQVIGWDVRPRWVAASSAFRTTLYRPDRTKTTPDATFSASQYQDVRGLDLSIEDVRNVIAVYFSDSAHIGTDGKSYVRKAVTVTDATSVAAYGRRYMELSEELSSQVDTSAEATAMANAALSDLATPYADMEVTAWFYPWAELGDLYRFTANGVHFDSDQDLAVVSVDHDMEVSEDGETTFRTSMAVRGKPSGGSQRWLQWDVRPGVAEGHNVTNASGGATLSVTDAANMVGGVRFRIAEKLQRLAKYDGVEIHVSTTNGFTPSSATLAAYGKASDLEVNNLTPGTTYYARAVPRQLNAGRIVQGKPTDQVTFVPGYVTTAKLADYAITTPKLSRASDPAGAAVSTVNIQDLAVQTAKLDNLAVTEGKIGSLAVTNGKLGNLSVSEGKLANLAVTNAKVADYSIKGQKLDDGPPFTPYQGADGQVLGTLALTYSGGLWAWSGVSVNPADITQNAVGTTFKLTGTADPYFWTGLTFYNTGSRHTPQLVIRYKTGSGTWPASFTCRVFGASNYLGSSLTYAASDKTFTAYGDGQWHTAEVDLSDWGSTTIVGTYVIRLDFPDSFTPTVNATFTIGYMALGAAGGGQSTSLYAAEGRVGVGGYPASYPVELHTSASSGLKWGVGASGYVAGGMAMEAVNNGGVFLSAAFVGADFSWWRTGGVRSMTLDSNGELGIGTSTPVAALHVVSRATNGTGAAIAEFRNASDGQRITVVDETTTGSKPPGIKSPVAAFGLGLYAVNGPMILHVGGTDQERLRLDSAGAVYTPNTGALGVGSSRWTSNGNDIFLNTNGSSAVYLRPSGTGSTTWQYEANAVSSYHRWLGASGAELARLNATGLSIGTGGAPGWKVDLGHGSLGTSLGATIYAISNYATTSNADYLRTFLYRNTSGGTSWTSADWYVERAVDTTTMGSVKYGGDGSIALAYNRVAKVRVYNDGWVYFDGFNGGGTTTASLDNAGKLIRTTSDGTLKEDLEPITNAMDSVKLMEPVTFAWKDKARFGPRRDVGLIAQDVRQIVPESVSANPDGTLSLDYTKLVPVLVAALQEQQRELDALKAQVAQLIAAKDVT